MPKVGIVGRGYVGRAVERAVSDYCHNNGGDVVVWDKMDPLGFYIPTSEADGYYSDQRAINACDLAFVCVPTPAGEDGRLDTSAVDEVLDWLRTPLIVIRSTMPVFGGNDGFGHPTCKVAYQPEFIGESPFAPWREERDCKLVVAGGFGAQEVIDFWKPILGPEVRYLATDWRTAAEIKFAVNGHGAVKTAWWMEYLAGCSDPDAVRNAVLDVPWIEPYHTLPLGGVGGKCLNKDLAHLAATRGGKIAKAALDYCVGLKRDTGSMIEKLTK